MSYHKKLPFSCLYCDKDFHKERQLKSHMKDTHYEEHKLNKNFLQLKVTNEMEAKIS